MKTATKPTEFMNYMYNPFYITQTYNKYLWISNYAIMKKGSIICWNFMRMKSST